MFNHSALARSPGDRALMQIRICVFFRAHHVKGPFTRDAASGGIAARLPLSLVVEAFCAVEAVLASRSLGGRYHSYKQQITFVFPKLNK